VIGAADREAGYRSGMSESDLIIRQSVGKPKP
jgi:hypothetical protein